MSPHKGKPKGRAHLAAVPSQPTIEGQQAVGAETEVTTPPNLSVVAETIVEAQPERRVPTDQDIREAISLAIQGAEEVGMTVGERVGVLDNYFGNAIVAQQSYLLDLHQDINAMMRLVATITGSNAGSEFGEINTAEALHDFVQILNFGRVMADLRFVEEKRQRIGTQGRLLVPGQTELLTP
jgi:hypothetical protein